LFLFYNILFLIIFIWYKTTVFGDELYGMPGKTAATMHNFAVHKSLLKKEQRVICNINRNETYKVAPDDIHYKKLSIYNS